jgi:hypothetical protein
MLRRYQILSFAIVLVSCGGTDSATPPPELASCTSGWQVVRPFEPAVWGPTALAWSAGALYFATPPGERNEIRSFPASGGETRTVTSKWGDHLWVEGDRLLVASFDELFSVPVTGGEATPVLQGGTQQLPNELRIVTDSALDGTHFYWLVLGAGTEVWRMPRAGGRAQRLAILPPIGQEREFRVTASGILVTGWRSDTVHLLSKETGEVRSLAPLDGLGGDVHGADDQRVLVRRWTGATATSATSALYQLPLSGSNPERFWPSMSPTLDMVGGWSDGRGGWLISALEEFTDGHRHASIWAVDGTGSGRRIACSAEALTAGQLEIITAVMPTPEGIYAAVARSTQSGWSVVKLPYPGP